VQGKKQVKWLAEYPPRWMAEVEDAYHTDAIRMMSSRKFMEDTVIIDEEWINNNIAEVVR
jgi:hypothetical protein